MARIPREIPERKSRPCVLLTTVLVCALVLAAVPHAQQPDRAKLAMPYRGTPKTFDVDVVFDDKRLSRAVEENEMDRAVAVAEAEVLMATDWVALASGDRRAPAIAHE